jgi:hypothetical protein
MNCALSFRSPTVFFKQNLSKGAGTYAWAGRLSTGIGSVSGEGEESMELGFSTTLAITTFAICIFGFASWRARQPAQPLKVRLVNYHVVQMAAIVVLLVMAAHLVTLFAGRPVTGQGGGRPF